MFLVEVTRIGSRPLLGWTEDNPLAQGFSFDVRGSAMSAAVDYNTCHSQNVQHRETTLFTTKCFDTLTLALSALCTS